MMRWMLGGGLVVGCMVLGAQAQSSGRAAIEVRSREPYVGAIAVDADTGSVLFEDGADAPGYPASVVKLMDLLIIQERIEQGQLNLSNTVTITAAASQMGGSQVFLAEKEVFLLEDLLYALMIQSANDAAMALALHVGGSADGFVGMMNQRAAALGMSATHFYSCHGLPPAAGDLPDESTARDLSILARELLKHPDILRYTSTRERGFRNDQFMLRTHNRLLAAVEGCDGLKTGYFKAGGFSIVATAQRNGRRVIVVVMGSPTREGRDAQATQLIAKSFLALLALPPPEARVAVVPAAVPVEPVVEAPAACGTCSGGWLCKLGLWVAAPIALLWVGIRIGRRQRGDGA